MCEAPVTTETFQRVYQSGKMDAAEGAVWFIDDQTNTFWTWDTPEIIVKKFTDIVAPLQLGGIMAWSFGEDSFDYAHVKALQDGYKGVKPFTKRTNAAAESWPVTLRHAGRSGRTVDL
ncbi:chitinase 18-11 [Diaporthe helianthi]|uniref:Chitinase 18-11 n=1 Tax=Diaporthe helianthi TaxID=158607 RepID=A0A2P5HG28_DIAHE|nr:chitinase 18-11 [Diaporthe helianthi]